jgi:hypothetical protein
VVTVRSLRVSLVSTAPLHLHTHAAGWSDAPLAFTSQRSNLSSII